MKHLRKNLFILVSLFIFLGGIYYFSTGYYPYVLENIPILRMQLMDFAFIGVCVISFFFHTLYYTYFPKNYSHLCFGLLSASVAVSLLFRGDQLITLQFPGLSQEWIFRILLISYALRIVSLLLYINSIFAKEMLQPVFLFLLILTSVFAFLILFSPMAILMHLKNAFCVITLLSALLAFYVAIKGFFAEYIGAPYYVIAFLVLTLGSYSDLLYQFGFTKLPSFLYIAQIFFVLLQSFLQAKQHYNAIQNTHNLTMKINTTLAEMQDNKSTFISSHIKPAFLTETLSVISNTCESNPDHADELILSLATYLRQMLDFDGKNKVHPISKELELIKAYRNIVAEHHPGLVLEYQIAENLPEIDLPPLSIQTLLENAVLHAFPADGDNQKVLLTITNNPNNITVTVSDNGIGMNEQTISYALDFPNRNLNVGLYDINVALQNMYQTSLSILSRIETGTVISFSLPLGKEQPHA